MDAVERIITEAESWVGTRYEHQQRVRGHGVDCAQLLCAVYEDAGQIEHIEPAYATQWFQHSGEERYVEWLMKFADEITAEEARPGDVIVWKFGRSFSHGGIITVPGWVVHAPQREGVCLKTEIATDVELSSRPARYFSILRRAAP